MQFGKNWPAPDTKHNIRIRLNYFTTNISLSKLLRRIKIEMFKMIEIKDHIRAIPDFPKPGILFYDISTLLANSNAWQIVIELLSEKISHFKPDILAGIDSRGFLVVAPVALKLGCGFTMIRKKGKLPGKVISYEYELEYGSDIIEIQEDAIEEGQRVVILDDLLATGGTMGASIELFEKVGANVVGTACIIELSFLSGRKKLKEVPFEALVTYAD